MSYNKTSEKLNVLDVERVIGNTIERKKVYIDVSTEDFEFLRRVRFHLKLGYREILLNGADKLYDDYLRHVERRENKKRIFK